MDGIRSFLERFMALFRNGSDYSEMTEEMRFHLEMEAEANMRTGMSEQEARRRAAISFGGVEWHRERVREERGFVFLENVARDLRVGLRQLRKSPGFTMVSVSSLGLGIGATVALFSVLNGVLLRPLPYGDPDRVVHIRGTHREDQEVVHEWLSYPEIADLRTRTRDLESVSAIQRWAPVLYGDANPVRLTGQSVSASYFSILDVQPQMGRFFLPEEGELGHDPVVVLGFGLWERVFGSDHAILGKSLDLSGVEHTVIGVAPRGFEPPLPPAEIWRSRP
ncbi:MAG: ABC transporter permease, partial [Longimicrobiales bacterium]